MHEMSLVEGLLRVVQDEMRTHPESHVQTVRVRVGRLRQVEPSMLEFCYEAAVRETSLAGSHLEIQQEEATARCDVCSLQFAVEEHWFECPRCHSSDVRLLTGDEVLLTSIVMESARN